MKPTERAHVGHAPSTRQGKTELQLRPVLIPAFAAALLVSALVALFKGMSLGNVIEGFGDGLKGVVVASVILMLALTIGTISQEAGGGLYLVELLGQRIPFWILPVCLLLYMAVLAVIGYFVFMR